MATANMDSSSLTLVSFSLAHLNILAQLDTFSPALLVILLLFHPDFGSMEVFSLAMASMEYPSLTLLMVSSANLNLMVQLDTFCSALLAAVRCSAWSLLTA